MKRQKTYETQKLTQSIFVHIKKYMKYLSTVIIKTIFFLRRGKTTLEFIGTC